MSELNYFGGDYRSWRGLKEKPVRANYPGGRGMEAHVFPEDLQEIEPGRALNFFWLNPKVEGDIDILLERGYFRVIANREGLPDFPNAKFIVKRWRSGPEGTVLRRGKEMWAQPAELGLKFEQEDARQFGGKRDGMNKAVEGIASQAQSIGLEDVVFDQGKGKSNKTKR